MSGGAFGQRLQAFRQKCQQILGPKRQGYGELSQLEQPLVSDSANDTTSQDAYLRQHGVQRPGGTGGFGAGAQTMAADPNTLQTEELRSLIDLGKDAASILWEMAALQNETENTKDILESVQQLQARIRGMVSDYKEGDEKVLAQALEIFDSLSNAMAEFESSKLGSPTAASGQPTPQASNPQAGSTRLTPPSYQQNPFQPTSAAQTAPGSKAPAEEAPLISFD